MLYLIGLGLNEKDVSIKAIDVLKKCDTLYSEFYTAKWNGNVQVIEELVGRKVENLRREDVESDMLIGKAKNVNVALLVAGDPLTATTHFQLLLDAKKAGIPCEIVHAPSIYTIIAETGLQLYKFGRTTTLVKSEETSPYDVVRENKKAGLHSLVLLDIDMDIGEGLKRLVKNGISQNVVACVNLGTPQAQIKYAPADKVSIRGYPAVILVPGKLNFKEEEGLELWK